MSYEAYKILHQKYFTHNSAVWTTDDYKEYSALTKHKDIIKWEFKLKLENAKFDYEDYCIEMANQIFISLDENGRTKFDDPDTLIFRGLHGLYAMPIHDGGIDSVIISYCPWCGNKLKEVNK